MPGFAHEKEFAEQMAVGGGMTYHIISGHQANKGAYAFLLAGDPQSTLS
jgi:hypothetical protein